MKFESFVIQGKDDGYLIRDMASEKGKSLLDISKIKKIQEMDHNELCTLLENVKERTELRTKVIADLLNN